jgi:hypothetical protein
MDAEARNHDNKNNPGQHDKDSVETYKDLTKLIITLSTGVFVLSPTFIGLLKFGSIQSFTYLLVSWGCLLTSILFGLFTLSTLAGTQHENKYNIDNSYTRWFARLQWGLFLGGIFFFGIFVWKNLSQCIKPGMVWYW